MDTVWFAVDQDGNIGLFHTSEDGALPQAACSMGPCGCGPREEFNAAHFACFAQIYWEVFDELRKEPDYNCQWVLPCALVTDANWQQELKMGMEWSLKPCRVATGVEEGGKLALRDRKRFVQWGPWLLSRRPLSAQTLRRIAGQGVWLIDPSKLYGEIDESRAEPVPIFQFGKEHGTDPGLYERELVPRQPLKAQDLPDFKVGKLQLPVQFQTSSQIHLADHMKDEDCFCGEAEALRWPKPPAEGA
jgi:hypothetical protein